jgi:hypothetical protein
VTLAGFGGLCGAVYRPVAEIVPVAEFPPGMLFTLQETTVLVDPVTVAWNCRVWPNATLADGGLMVTTTSCTGGRPAKPQPKTRNEVKEKARLRGSARKKRIVLIRKEWLRTLEGSCSDLRKEFIHNR